VNPVTRRAFAGLAAASLLPLRPALAADSALPIPASLAQAGAAAQAKGEPLVILVSLPGCPYCELVRRNYLLPMRAEGLHAWQVDVTDRRRPISDFSGAVTSAAALAARWKATYTPTVLFFSGKGVEIATRLVGVAVPDFYGAYLDQSLAQGRKALGRGV
jgi:thioredoxin-related protein